MEKTIECGGHVRRWSTRFRDVVVSTAAATLLLVGAAGSAAPVQPAHAAAGSAPALHDSACTGDVCPDGMCSPGQCLMGATTSCHCSCMLVTTESISEPDLPSLTATIGSIIDAVGSASGRLDKPFRPPA
jgi:hypothetical protein